MVELHAFEGHLKRMLKSIDSDGALDRETGLLSGAAFWRDLERAVRQAEDGGGALSVARFAFDGIDRRASIDAARLFSRLVRSIDFACREQDLRSSRPSRKPISMVHMRWRGGSPA
jgi:hypothetical protein